MSHRERKPTFTRTKKSIDVCASTELKPRQESKNWQSGGGKEHTSNLTPLTLEVRIKKLIFKFSAYHENFLVLYKHTHVFKDFCFFFSFLKPCCWPLGLSQAQTDDPL